MKQFIKNNNNEKLCVQVFEPMANVQQLKLAVICHGITGYKEQDVIMQTMRTLTNFGYRGVVFDCRNSRGESFNNHSCASFSSMCDDLQTVINWIKTQNFYVEPFLLAGHSLGGSVVLNFAEQYSQVVSGLILVSSIFDGNKFLYNTQTSTPEFFQQLQNGGVIRSRNGVECYLDSTYLYDFMNYNLLTDIHNLKMPILVVTGDQDTASTIEDNKSFYQCLECKKQLHILQNCSHIYDTLQNQADLNDKIIDYIVQMGK